MTALAVLCAVPVIAAPSLDATAVTASGTFRGSRAAGVATFKGIPYAAPPVGDLRWAAPQAPAAWTGTRDATQFGARCWSTLIEAGLGDGGASAGPQSEDCLTLNIWSAAKSPAARLPVMVWIHGGGLQFGTARNPKTDGTILAQHGVVVVSLNYRLGVFGFFAHPRLRDHGVPTSNFGTLDQIAALKWVQANIAAFGGDPSNVTIFGESAGSMSVSILMASPLAKGLFAKAIGESGAALSPIPTTAEVGLRGLAYSAAIGAKTIEDLRAMPAETLNTAAAWDFPAMPIVFTASVDGNVLPARPVEIFARGRQNDVPLLAGYNAREEYPFIPLALPHRTAAEFRFAAGKMFAAADPAALATAFPATTDAEAKASAEAMIGDILLRMPTWRWIESSARTGHAPVYGYRFEYQSAYSPIASHVAEIPFIFGNFVPQFFALDAPPANAGDHAVATKMMGYWTNFAKTGDPNGPGLPRWPKFDAAGTMLVIGEQGEVSTSPDPLIPRYKFISEALTGR